MSDDIAQQLIILNNIKNDIKESINTKGGEITADTPFTQYAEAIDELPSGGSVLITKTIKENGVYSAVNDNADGYSEVTVNVPTALDKVRYNPYIKDVVTFSLSLAETVTSYPFVQNPAMISDVMGDWVANASTQPSGAEAYKAFNKDMTGENCWWTGDGGYDFLTPSWLTLDFPHPQQIKSVEITNEVASPENFKDALIQARQFDSLEWITLYTITDRPNTTGYSETYSINDNREFIAFRLYITDGYTYGSRCSIQNINVNFKNALQPANYTIINVTKNGGSLANDGIYTGAPSSYIISDSTLPLSTANSWEFRTAYMYRGGGEYPAIFGQSDGIHQHAPFLSFESGALLLYLSSNGSSWDIVSGGNSGIVPTTGTIYYLKVGFTGTEYYIDYNTTGWDDAFTRAYSLLSSTKVFNNCPLALMNMLDGTNRYYSTGSMSLFDTEVDINGSLYWSAVEATNVPKVINCERVGGALSYKALYTGGSGFYCRLNEAPPFSTADNWEVKTVIYPASSNGSEEAGIWGMDTADCQGMQVILRNYGRNLATWISSTGNSWDIADAVTNSTYDFTNYAGQPVYMKFGFTGTEYYIDFNLTGWNDTFTRAISIPSTNKVYTDVNYRLMNHYWTPTSNCYYSGTMDLKETSITVDGSLWWMGYGYLVNYSLYGAPTSTLGVINIVAGGSQYITTKDTSLNFNNPDTWSIITKQKISHLDYADNGFMGLNGDRAINVYASSGNKINVELSSDGSSFDIGTLNMDSTVADDTWFYTKIEFTGTEYNLYSGSSLNNLQLEDTISSTTKVNDISNYFGFGSDWSAVSNAFTGSFDMSECYIYMDGSLVWQGLVQQQ